MISVRNKNLIEEIFNNHHDIVDQASYEKCYTIRAFCKTELNSSEKFEVENYLTVGEVVDKFNIKCIEFTCEKIGKTPLDVTLDTKKTVDAFQVLMAGGRAYPDLKTSK